ncbi:FHA domain-containing protein [bacterium]|nr:FHA domain-containing protein [bacterium]
MLESDSREEARPEAGLQPAESPGERTSLHSRPDPRALYLGTPEMGTRRLADLVLSATSGAQARGGHGLVFPVVVSHPDDHVPLAATVYPLSAMTGSTVPACLRLEGEISRFFLGRSPGNAIVVGDQSVSKRHASIVRLATSWAVVDEGSRNGTYLDGQKLRPGIGAPIESSLAMIRLGPSAHLSFMHEASFDNYLKALACELGRGEAAPGASERSSPGTLHATWAARIADSPLAAKILRKVLGLPFVPLRYEVALEGANIEELGSWPELVTFVEREAAKIFCVEAIVGPGQHVAVYRREGAP